MAEVRQFDSDLARRLRYDPLAHLRAIETACHAVASEERPGYDKDMNQPVKVAISGPISASALSPRQLNSACLRQLVCVEGVASKVSVIKPKVVQSTHYCPATQQHQTRDYVDATDPRLGLKAVDKEGRELPDRVIHITTSVYPTKDKEGNSLETEFGLSVYKDHQTITLQEMPEKAPMGQLPRSVELVLDDDLVDTVKPGDRVAVVGVYRALALASNGQQQSSGVFRVVVLVNHVRILGRSESQLHFSTTDVRTIRSLAKEPDILSTLGRSICPSIHGHHMIKQALALQLLSGVEKNLANGTHLRGDINVLLVGDPSTAKSQLLRAAMTLAPLAVSTTGKGSSGVGLTAAVTSDPDTRERRLEAGAMVLGDRGLVCVDEFDKMSENDRVAIHEAMEQQTVTIAKAGLHAQLNARCSVLAAANPVYGQYDRRKGIHENIGLPDSLLSRFDLLFVVLDQMDAETDRRIANHVIRGHQYRPQLGQAGHDSDDEDASDDDADADPELKAQKSVWQRNATNVLQHDFLRKYIHFCKTRVQPVLTNEARQVIAHRYSELRARQDPRTLPITARSLETVIRLSTAHAKARLSTTVDVNDVQVAMDLLGFALYHEQQYHAPKKSSSETNNALLSHAVVSESDDEDHLVDSSDEASPSKRARIEASGDAMSPVWARIWSTLSENDGMMTVEELSKSLEGVESLDDTINEMVENNRLAVTDGFVYQV
jgi:DNA replication licensing factor MCM3